MPPQDHFSFYKDATLNGGTYKQRYFLCTQYWKPHKGPIFFYAGNEADVELYLTHTGLMWENAEEFGALLLFAEHRCVSCGDDIRIRRLLAR